MNTIKTLTRSEMKSIMAGGGNIHCSVGGQQIPCFGQSDLIYCTELCIAAAERMDRSCDGCAQFPAHQQ